jgi:hypothetical protein
MKQQWLSDATNAVIAADVAAAGFDTVIVGLFHVNGDGTINYNDFPLESDLWELLCEGITALKTSPGSTVKTLLFSFGGDGTSDTDYAFMKDYWTYFKPLMLKLVEKTGGDGVDWDYEPQMTFDTEFIIRITNEIAGEGYLVTAAPFTDMSSWETVIEGTVKAGGSGNNFAWWNLQLYSLITDYRTWAPALQNDKTGMSPSGIEKFLIPGYAPPACNYQPAIDDIKGLRQTFPNLGGAFIWNYSGIANCAPQVASAIKGVFNP